MGCSPASTNALGRNRRRRASRHRLTLRPRGARWHRERLSPSLAEAAHAFLILFDPRLNLLRAEFAWWRQFSRLRPLTRGQEEQKLLLLLR